MKLTIVLLACVVGIATLGSTQNVTAVDKSFLEKQKFLYEIVYRVEDPLMFEEWIKLGNQLIVDKSFYNHYDIHMEKFWESYKEKALLPKGEFFGNLVKSHYMQAWGLFNFFYYAKDWDVFQRNVCWARMHVNEGMFVHALTLAIIHRDDFVGLMLPYIYEIFPQHFFDSRFVYAAEKFDYNIWSKYAMYEKQYLDVYYKDNNKGNYVHMKDWKMWQWWKLMGLDRQWYMEENYMLRENIYEHCQDAQWLSMMKDIKMLWMPVDYTRDIEYANEESALSYFTEDAGWNAFWYYFSMDYPFFLDGETFNLQNDRRGEFWVYGIQKLLARYYMERLSHGLGEIPHISRKQNVKNGYNPRLVSYNGIGYSYRKDYYHFYDSGNFDMIDRIREFFGRIESVVDMGYYKMKNGTMVDLRQPNAAELIGNILQGNVDVMDKYFFNYWYLYSHMYLAGVDYNDVEVLPHAFLNMETVMRDPLIYGIHKRIVDVFYRFKNSLGPYKKEELLFPGVHITDVKVSELVTYFDIFDFDVTNLINGKIRIVDGEFVWDKTLLARQMRLNHKPINFEITVESDKPQKVYVRVYLGPKYNELGQVIALNENRMNFFSFDKFSYELTAGTNVIKRNPADYLFTSPDALTYTEMYNYIKLAHEGKYEFNLSMSHPHCSFPNRLMLPRGWEQGMPMQLFFMITLDDDDHDQFDYTFSCGLGSGRRWLDHKPFAYPFDREIDEYDFYVPNMYFKDVMIYHQDNLKMYRQLNYTNFGNFDYNYFDDYYTKGVSN
ncbi:larval serum protein 1 beta chain-like [Musca vetustissima]|uniref:larval serum protein 1 beta chain-like n=1 Tax=Musca vetustissima TaxID=27455 RepID=UPI002AB5E7FF|nr:larval serum protein 1 beta chain-like [Musca vetustissima]